MAGYGLPHPTAGFLWLVSYAAGPLPDNSFTDSARGAVQLCSPEAGTAASSSAPSWPRPLPPVFGDAAAAADALRLRRMKNTATTQMQISATQPTTAPTIVVVLFGGSEEGAGEVEAGLRVPVPVAEVAVVVGPD